MKKLVVILLTITLLTACGEKKIDTASSESKVDITSAEAYDSSVMQIFNSLNEEEKNKFMESIAIIVYSSDLEAHGDPKKMKEIVFKKIHGKTASEIIKLAGK